jgi:hypothetical protein
VRTRQLGLQPFLYRFLKWLAISDQAETPTISTFHQNPYSGIQNHLHFVAFFPIAKRHGAPSTRGIER